MNAMTVRGLDAQVMDSLKRAARERQMSVNQFVLETLRQRLGLTGAETRHHDMDEFFGSWSREERDQVLKSVRQQRKIDEELWS